MVEMESIDILVAARQFLKTNLEKSRAISSALDDMGPRLEEINQRLPSLEAAVAPVHVKKCAFSAVRDHIDSAIGPAAAVLKVFDTVRELEKSLLSDPCSDLSTYLSVMKQLEQALRFLADNCRLAIQWLEGIVKLAEDNAVAANDHRCLSNVKKSLKILQKLQANDQGHDVGGLLNVAFSKLETEFMRLLTEETETVPLVTASVALSPLPAPVVQKLQVIIERLNSDYRLETCVSTYVDVRSSNAKCSLQAVGLDYLEMSIDKFDDVKSIEGYVDQWSMHLMVAVKNLFDLEYKLCNDIFKNIGSDVATRCFAKIAAQSGILAFLQFGKNVTFCKKDPFKLLKLLDMFASLNSLRSDFNRLFGGKGCEEIQNLMRDLVRRVVDGACEIFRELPLQVEMQRRSSPPSDGGVPKLVSFLTAYCNQLLGDDYRPILTQVLVIHQSWKKEKFEEGVISYQVYNIMKEIGLNLDAWSKAYEDVSLSYLFMMNNHFHFRNLRGTKIGEMMGDSWLTAHDKYKDYYAALYMKESWGKLVDFLNHKKGGDHGDLVNKRLKEFNEGFDERYKKQSNWVVSEESLREKLCQHLVQVIVPVYMSYIQNYYKLFVEENTLKYSDKCLEKMLNSLFQPKLRNCGGTKHVDMVANVKHKTWSLETMISSLFQSKLKKHGSTKRAHLIRKMRNVLTNQFRLTLAAI